MILEGNAIIVGVREFSESRFIVKCFFQEFGVISGMIRIYNTKKGFYRKPLLGDIVKAKWQARLEEHLGYLSYDVIESPLSLLAGEEIKVLMLNSAVDMVSFLLAESDSQPELFQALFIFIQFLTKTNEEFEIWHSYIKFEIGLLSTCGYGLDLSKCVVTAESNNLKYISPKSASAVSEEAGLAYHDKLFQLPKFLLDDSIQPDLQDISESLKMTYFFLEKNAFQAVNRKLPISRKLLQNFALRDFAKKAA